MSELIDQLQQAVGKAYRIEGELGGGGMSRVFVANETELGRRVVIKVLPPEMAAGVNQDRFRREVQLAAQLQHPHIVPMLTAGSAGHDRSDLLYYVMPYVTGESLRAKLAREGELPVDEVARILEEVVDALAYAHRQGVVHRDIKPDNILLSENHALVADFGVAKAVSKASTGESKLTSLGVALGTPTYMAPEQAAADPHTDHRADIYAIGVVAYEMLAGRPPFAAPTPQGMLAAHVSQPPDPVTTHRTSVPPILAELVMRCLAKKAADRWQRADEMLPALKALTTPTAGLTPTGTRPITVAGIEGVLRRRPLTQLVGIYGLVSLVVLGAVYLLMMALGLPGWVLPGAVALLAAGLPIVLFTAHVERLRVEAGAPTPGALSGWISWRKALLGGVLAFAGLGATTAAYSAMRVAGIGPAATLMATGAMDARDRLIVADFDNRTDDSTLGPSVTAAFRIDLAQSPVLRLVDASDIAPVLQRMNREPGSPLDLPTALEVAEREGLKGVVAGEISPVGSGYVLAARVLASEDGSQLLALRETADGDAELIQAIDRLSGRLRERIGESLKTIRANEPLERVTTTSLEALRKYSQGNRAFEAGNYDRAIPLLEEALTIDTTFAMAYRKLAAAYNNTGAGASRQIWAATMAFQFRDRLPDVERYLATAYYYHGVEFEPDQVRTAYLNVLDVDPEHAVALNNLALVLNNLKEYEEAERYAVRAAEAHGLAPAYNNAMQAQVGQGAYARADSTLRRFEAAQPDHPAVLQLRGSLFAAQRRYDSAQVAFQRLRERFGTSSAWRPAANFALAALNEVRGKVAAAAAYRQEEMTAAAERNLGSDYLRAALLNAYIDVLYRDDSAAAVARIDGALARFPLQQMEPADRPYLFLVQFYADAGEPARARRLFAEYQRELDPVLRRGDLGVPFVHSAIALAEGDVEGAIRLSRDGETAVRCQGCGDFRRALAYERAGQPDSAIAEYERVLATPDLFRHFQESLTLAPTYKRLGELYERRGEAGLAVEYYNRFAELWDGADPEFQPQVREVRERLARLVGET